MYDLVLKEGMWHEIAFSEGKRRRSFFQVAVSGWEKQRKPSRPLMTCYFFGFHSALEDIPGGSDSEASAYNVGDTTDRLHVHVLPLPLRSNGSMELPSS